MTESHLNQHAPFEPYSGHRRMTPADAAIFTRAAEQYAHPDATKAIRAAGGDMAHCNHFSREACNNAPPVGWACRQDSDTVRAALVSVGEGLR